MEEKNLSPKEIRKVILETMYNSDERDFFRISELAALQESIGDRALYNEIKYLEGKGYIEILDAEMSAEILNFSVLKITSYGIDLVEDPEEFKKLFSVSINNFGDVNDSNVVINSRNTNAIINKEEISEEMVELLVKLKEATDKGDESKILKILSKIGGMSKDLLIGIASAGIYEFIKKSGLPI